MKVSIKLFKSDGASKYNSFPIKIVVSHKGKTIRETISNSLLKDWDDVHNLPLKTHPEFDELYPEILTYQANSYKSFVRKSEDIKEVLEFVLERESTKIKDLDFYKFADVLVQEFRAHVDENGRKKEGNASVYENAVNQLKRVAPTLKFSQLDYNLLTKFKNFQLAIPNKKTTIHHYLRTYRAIYNEGIKRYKLTDNKPFNGIFKGITVKKNRTKKRYLLKKDIQLLEKIKNKLPGAQKRAVDFWLLQFYLGGADLVDVYYLKALHLVKNRVFFTRGKLSDGGYQFDLKIHVKAQKIIDTYCVDGPFVFGFRKDRKGYMTFRDNMRRELIKIQKKEEIIVQPLGGNLTSKVARHTFATIAKFEFIESDLLRELMGHERDDIDTVYKDKYPQEVRDEAHFKIIE